MFWRILHLLIFQIFPRKYLPKRQSYGHWRGSIRVEQKLKERSLPMNLESLFKATERREYIFSGK